MLGILNRINKLFLKKDTVEEKVEVAEMCEYSGYLKKRLSVIAKICRILLL